MNTVNEFTSLLERPLQQASATPRLYLVKAGDTLSRIIRDHYGIAFNSDRYKVAEASVFYFNADIKDPNKIYANQLLRLMPLPAPSAAAACRVPADFYETRRRLEPAGTDYINRLRPRIPVDPQRWDVFWALAMLQEHYNWLGIPAGVGLNTFGRLAGSGNTGLVQQVGAIYRQYKNNSLTANQYNYQRRKLLKQLANNLARSRNFCSRAKPVCKPCASIA